jgi:PAS domain S-box-containing protein
MDSVINFFKKIFDTSGFMPRWSCGRWTDVHGWVYIISNLVIGFSYLAIPLLIVYFIRKKKEVPFKGVFVLFSLFIIFCGITHIVDANMFWFPLYRLNAVFLAITAIISAATVFALYKNLPIAFNLKSPEQLQKIIDEQTAILQLTNQRLKASEEQFKALVNNNPDIITLMGSDLQYKFVNDSLGMISFKNLNDYIGKTPFEVLPFNPHTSKFTEQLQYVFDAGEKVNYEVESFVAKRGASYFSVQMIPLFDKLENVSDVLTITKDITEIKLNEKKLNETIDELNKLTKRLEFKRNTMQDFTYMVSHNLRSPTGNLIALIDLYKRTSDLEKKELFLAKIFEVSGQLGNTVHDLSEVLNINENTELQKELLRFDTVVESQITNLSSQIMDSKASISYDFSACESILYPKVYLESIILNLLTNALKYSSLERNPEIRITTKKDPDGLISFYCKDNGMGIDLKKFGSKIFSLYKTFHNKPDSKGVGLFITKNQINSMGGSINVQSEVGIGTIFVIHFNEIDLL